MSDLRQTRLKIWDRVNEAIGAGDLNRASREADALLNNVRPALEEKDEERLDEFLDGLEEEYNKGISAVNEQTKDLKPLDRNEVRRIRYGKMHEYRIAEMYSFLSELLYNKDLIPTGE